MLFTSYKMLAVHADRYYIFCIALCCICVSSNGQQYCEIDSCETSTLHAPLGSSVVLPCLFGNALQSFGLDWVLWAQNPGSGLVNLTSNGSIQFLDPRHGRVKAFPYLGNYSIRIDELQESDLGCYRCQRADGCHQVDVSEQVGGRSTLLVYIVGGVVALVLLLGTCSYYCVKWLWSKNPPDYVNTGNPISVETGRENIEREDEQERGANTNQVVYENDEYDPANHQDGLTRNHCDFTGILHDLDGNQATPSGNVPDPTRNPHYFARGESQRRRQGFHIELLSRLRQASFTRHYYVNHTELNQQAMSSQMENRHRASFWRKKVKRKYEHENPIYNNSRDHLNKL